MKCQNYQQIIEAFNENSVELTEYEKLYIDGNLPIGDFPKLLLEKKN